MRLFYSLLPTALLLFFLCGVGDAADIPPSAFHPDGGAPDWNMPEVPRVAPEGEAGKTATAERPLIARIAQLMLVTLEGVTAPSANDLAFLKDTLPGGVVVPHATKASAAAAYVNMLHAIAKSAGKPLLVGTDLYRLTEPVRHVPSGFIQLPSLLAITASGDRGSVKDLARLMAQHVHFMGFNFHFGPTLELAPTLSGARNTIHTFGSDPDFAAEAGLLFHETFTENRVLYMPAGFPGGGANRADRNPAVLTTPRQTLLDHDALPYRKLAEQGVGMMHVGNVLSPTLDPENRPASMSSVVITDILRGEMGFEGVVVAGPMDDEVLRTRYDSSEAALQALEAGADMLYWQGGLLPVLHAIARIAAEVETGALDEARINRSLERLDALKASLNTPDKPVTEREAAKQAGQEELVETSRKVERHAITLLKNDGNVLPLIKKVSTPVGITGTVGVDELHSLLKKELKQVVQQRITTAHHIGEIQRFEIERLTKNMRGIRTVICVLTDGIRVETQMELLQALKANAPRVVVIYLGHPQNAARLTSADALVLAYCDTIAVAQTLEAMAGILIGNAPLSILSLGAPIDMKAGEARSFNAGEVIQAPSGRLPITLSPEFPAGTAARYNPAASIKRVEWDFGGDSVRKENVVRKFDTSGEVAVTLTVTDVNDEVCSGTFTVRVRE